MIGAKNLSLTQPHPKPVATPQQENTKILNPGSLTGADDLADLPDYLMPYIGSEDHPIHVGVGRNSPDVAKFEKAAQTVVPVLGAPDKIGAAVRTKNTDLGLKAKTQPQFLRPPAIDPLTGANLNPIEIDHKIDTGLVLAGMLNTLEAILTVQRAQIPQLPCNLDIDGYVNDLSNIKPKLIRFKLGQKHVPALKLIIQNNINAQVIFIDLVHDATPGSIALTSGQIFVASVVTDTISILAGAAGPYSINGGALNNVVVSAWSNMEWSKMWGEI